MRSDEASHHAKVQKDQEDQLAEVVDPARIEGKKMPLPGESSVAIYWRSGAVSSGHSSQPATAGR